MYGGNGIVPIRCTSSMGFSSSISTTKVSPASVRGPTRTTRFPKYSSTSSGLSLLAGFTRASHKRKSDERCSNNNTSAAPPVLRCRDRRAGNTRVSLTTITSPGSSMSTRSVTCLCSTLSGPVATNSRAESRGSTGC